MFRTVLLSIAAVLLAASILHAAIASVDLGIGITVGAMQPGGGDNDYEDTGLIAGIQVSKPLTETMWIAFDYRHGQTNSADDPTSSRFSSWGEADDFRTLWNHAELSLVWRFMPEQRFTPYLGGGFGFSFWETEDWRGTVISEGDVAEGYDDEGKVQDLHGTSFTAVVGAGVEMFATNNIAFQLGGKFRYLLSSSVDNVGWSAMYGADYVDANNYVLEGSLGLMYYFGAGDCDGDGILGKQDKCWKDPEDFDGFEDDDGCPDPDNDGDGILDVDDKCPNDAEDFDGDEDEDGCPDIDTDGDGIPDDEDACVRKAEDFDGFEDDDGCPDPDNDGDGVGDAMDKCPNTAAGVEVDANGCPKPKAELVAVMVLFDLNSAALGKSEQLKLVQLTKMMQADEEIVVEVDGHACDLGTDTYNTGLSDRRAAAVKEYLIAQGVDPARVVTVAMGEADPLVPNDSEAQRRQNRRAMITPTRP